MHYLTAQDILVIHAQIIDATGGSHGIRDMHLLASLVERPKTAFGGDALYATIEDKAATILQSLAQYHVFVDGNKRTAFVATARFLHTNGLEFHGSNKEVEHLLLNVVEKKLAVLTIARWLRRHI